MVEAGAFGDVFELQVAFVAVQPVAGHVCGEEDVLETVVVDVSYSNAGAVIEIFEGDDVEVFVFVEGVLEVDAGLGWRE